MRNNSKSLNTHSYKNVCMCVLVCLISLTYSLNVNASIKHGDATVYVGNTTTLTLGSAYQRTLQNATGVSYQWYSDNSSYVSVTSSSRYSATVKGVSPTSSCRVYFYCSYYIDGFYRTMDFYYDVTVKSSTVYVTDISLNKSSASLTVGNTLQLSASVYPSNATNRSVNWSSSNSSVASVSSSGYVTAKASGTATITCRAADGSGEYATCSITVEESKVYVTSVSLNKSGESLEIGGTCQLTATVYPSNATNRSVTWSSSNSSVASVSSSGLVTAKASGTATITCTAADGSGKYATCTITVAESKVYVTSVSLNKSSESLEIGGTCQLTATVYPSNATNRSVTWSSSNSSVASVNSSGLVTAKASGTATITCQAADGSGKSATCTITVTDTESASAEVTIGNIKYKIENGEAAVMEQSNTLYGNIVIPETVSYNGKQYTVTSLLESAFVWQDKITGITLPNSLKYINTYAFAGCEKITNINIPSNVESFSTWVFQQCYSLSEINVAADNKFFCSKDGVLYSKDMRYLIAYPANREASSFDIPESVISMYAGAFNYATKLENISIPDGLTTLSNGAFYNCSSLRKIEIPGCVNTIYGQVFYNCTSLSSVVCEWTDLSELAVDGDNIFEGVPSEAKLTVPKGTKTMYQVTEPWSNFRYIEEAEEEQPEEEPEVGEESDLSKYDDVIYFEKAEGQSGTSMTLSLMMKNKMEVSGMQANLYMPEGIKITKITRGEGLKAIGDGEYIYTFGAQQQDDGSHFLLSYSAMNVPMSAGEREIAKVVVEIAEDVKAGDYPLLVKNIEMSYGSENVKVEKIQTTLEISDYVLGDANGDGSVSVTDITSIAAYLMDNSKTINKNAADANKDGNISVTDITQIGKMLFSNAVRGLTRANARQTTEGVNIVLADGKAEAGNEITLPVSITGCASAFQFDVYTPQGISVKKVQRGSLLKAMDENDEYIFTLQSSSMDGGAFHRVVAYNTTDTPTAEAGEVMKLVLQVDENLSAGEYNILLKETECGQSGVVLSTSKETTAKLTIGLDTDAIDFVDAEDAKPIAIYTIDGVKISKAEKGKVYIFHYANGNKEKRLVR